MEPLEETYISNIKTHKGVLHKIAGLYTDTLADEHDLIQEMMLQGWRSFKQYEGRAAFSTWLYRICLNTALTFRKKEKKRLETLHKIQPQESLDQKEDYEVLYYLVKQLNEVDRMIMTLHLEGFKNQEIAEIAGISTNKINVKLHRLKAHIIDQYKTLHHG